MNAFIRDFSSSSSIVKILTSIDNKGRLLIPISVRRKYNLKTGNIKTWSLYGYLFEKKLDYKGRLQCPKKIRQKVKLDNDIILIELIIKNL